MTSWQVQEAKNRFSEVVERASQGEVQIITRRGVEVAAIISFEQYSHLKKPKQTLVEFLANSPLAESELNVVRVQGDDRPAVEL